MTCIGLRGAGRRDRKPKSVGISKSENADSPGVGGFRLQDAAARDDPARDLVDGLWRRQLERKAFALDPPCTLGSVILAEKEPDVPRAQRDRHQPAFALELAVDGEADDVAVPCQASLKVGDRERRLEALGGEGLGRAGGVATAGGWIGHDGIPVRGTTRDSPE